MTSTYFASGFFRPSDIGEGDQPVCHAVINPIGEVHVNDLDSFEAAGRLAAVLNKERLDYRKELAA